MYPQALFYSEKKPTINCNGMFENVYQKEIKKKLIVKQNRKDKSQKKNIFKNKLFLRINASLNGNFCYFTLNRYKVSYPYKLCVYHKTEDFVIKCFLSHIFILHNTISCFNTAYSEHNNISCNMRVHESYITKKCALIV